MSYLKFSAPIHDYTSGDRFLAGRNSRTLCYATTVEREREHEAAIIVRHHGSVIARFWENGDLMLTNAGWNSTTTRTRLNLLAPADVGFFQRDWTQYVTEGDVTIPFSGVFYRPTRGTEVVAS